MDDEIRQCMTADGVRLAYRVTGQGPPIVVAQFSPWSGLDMQRSRRSLAGVLSRYATVVTYDGRATGLSSGDSLGDDPLACAMTDLVAVTDAAGMVSGHVVSLAAGAMPAIAMAVAMPERVRSLTLWGPSVDGGTRGSSPLPSALETLRNSEAAWELYISTFASATLGDAADPRVPALTRLFRTAGSPRTVRMWDGTVRAMDVTDLCARVTVPTLVIHSGTYFPAGYSADIASRIPGARFLPLAGKSQLNSGEEQYLPALLRFLGIEDVTAAAPNTSGAAPSSGVTTVLFTDIVGHTEMMRRLGDAKGRDVLREHERITRETLKQHGGAEVKTMGDGFMASFASVTSAVECAIALQRAFASPASPSPLVGEGLGVRCGINAGEPIAEDGDLFGASVILASRIAAQAGAGEILIPEPVRHLLAGKSHVFADRGEFAMKGFDDAVRLYEVRWR